LSTAAASLQASLIKVVDYLVGKTAAEL